MCVFGLSEGLFSFCCCRCVQREQTVVLYILALELRKMLHVRLKISLSYTQKICVIKSNLSMSCYRQKEPDAGKQSKSKDEWIWPLPA